MFKLFFFIILSCHKDENYKNFTEYLITYRIYND
jgi:hypothetical protein